MRILAFRCTVAVAVVAAACAHANGARSARQKGKTMHESESPITLTVAAEPHYLAGFPLLVAVELRNVSPGVHRLLPYFGLFTVPGPVSFKLEGGGHEWTWKEKAPGMEGGPEGVDFGPGKAWWTLQDLGELHPDLPPGHYQLSATVLFPGHAATAAPVPIEIQAASAEDRAIATRLRATNDAGKPSWQAFARENWSTPELDGLSPGARQALAYYLYLHRAAYGPRAIAALDPQEPWQLGHGVLEAEAGVLRLEILRAAGKPEAAGIEAAVLERWPGLAWRVEEIQEGGGLLTRLRRTYGVERSSRPVGKPEPYRR
jgi:hypothetical protein